MAQMRKIHTRGKGHLGNSESHSLECQKCLLHAVGRCIEVGLPDIFYGKGV